MNELLFSCRKQDSASDCYEIGVPRLSGLIEQNGDKNRNAKLTEPWNW